MLERRKGLMRSALPPSSLTILATLLMTIGASYGLLSSDFRRYLTIMLHVEFTTVSSGKTNTKIKTSAKVGCLYFRGCQDWPSSFELIYLRSIFVFTSVAVL